MEKGFYIHPDAAKELACAQYVDMLNDQQRNQFYQQAIHEIVGPSTPLVLDIGTGTGLLSIMAAQHGAQKVIACDTSYPLCRVAQQTATDNGFADTISIFNMKSTEMAVGNELPDLASVCVNEIVDSSLLGEHILPTLRHAIQHLLKPNFKMVPHSALIFGAVIESPKLWEFHSLEETDNSLGIKLSTKCSGGSHEPLEIHFSHAASHIKILTEQQTLFSFSFTDISTLQSHDISTKTITPTISGTAHAVLLWWEMSLDEAKKYTIGTAPGKSEWRNHWKQCIYFLPTPLPLTADAPFHLTANRDDFNLWFSASAFLNSGDVIPSSCTCDLHGLYRRTRISMLNDKKRNTKYSLAIQKACARISARNGKTEISCLLLGEDPFLGFIAASHGVHVIQKESRSFFREIGAKRISENQLDGKFQQVSTLSNQSFDLLIAEPFYFDVQRKLPWEELSRFLVEKSEIQQFLTPDAEIIPSSAKISGVAVKFDKFQKQFDNVSVPGIDLDAFNNALSCVQPVTAHGLWQYDFKEISTIFSLLEIDFCQSTDSDQNTLSVEIQEKGMNGVALWVDYSLTDTIVCSNRPRNGQNPTWKRQAVWSVQTNGTEPPSVISASASYDVFDGAVKVQIEIPEDDSYE